MDATLLGYIGGLVIGVALSPFVGIATWKVCFWLDHRRDGTR